MDDTLARRDSDEIALDRQASLYLRSNTPKGRGVFAAEPIATGKVLEISPVLVLSPDENAAHVARTELYNYTYNWPITNSADVEDASPQQDSTLSPLPTSTSHIRQRSQRKPTTTQAIVLGLGSMFNHSSRAQNVGWSRDITRQVIIYRALRDIARDEELCISYGDRLTFIDADAKGVESGNDDTDQGLADDSGFLGRIDLDVNK